uniref:Uncharacterized protein n=1 Tax=Chromera velia CCMP2878 TaxID=1169474 RepID=A0A0G4FHT4_9ALVE|eukprot:Cvel_17078.t1-p1 / transcript=Cvel_17078.t1 / gene=Cvel_17078 / organism=Chromera_velia_CCMP2878 / gene_product=hypothetical protein / transcript_product=hypothetical protein / location=Cvel_scaffold1347:766-1020(+) / protein_length=85 / sequence_SO=supercontig / SO=protein_coding / is_pseudo=false
MNRPDVVEDFYTVVKQLKYPNGGWSLTEQTKWATRLNRLFKREGQLLSVEVDEAEKMPPSIWWQRGLPAASECPDLAEIADIVYA